MGKQCALAFDAQSTARCTVNLQNERCRLAALLRTRRGFLSPSRILGQTLGIACLFFGGCDAFSPAFLSLVSPEGASGFSSLENAPGHVVIAFINNAQMDERLVEYLLGPGGVSLNEAERRSLRPRIRFRVQVTFDDGTTMPIEFVDGSAVIDRRFDADVFPDLDQNTLNNVTVICDVAAVEILPGSQIEVFMPVELLQYERIDIQDARGVVVDTEFRIDQRIPPTFRRLEIDTLDADGNVIVNRNIDVRDVPAPVTQPFCGSVIAIILEGELDVPFLTGVDDNPSFDRDDVATVNTIGGFHKFTVTVR